jgi:predicted nucleic acid-binding Zn ribbon protein
MMKRLGSAVEKLLRSYNLWQGYQQHLLVENWAGLVGPALAEVTRAERITNGVLRVSVKDSVWAYHLSMLKPQLIKKLNNHAGSKVVRDIFFNIDTLDKKE